MNPLERFYKIDQLLQDRQIVPRSVFLEELEISLATSGMEPKSRY
jgi:hypothetical protein